MSVRSESTITPKGETHEDEQHVQVRIRFFQYLAIEFFGNLVIGGPNFGMDVAG